MRPDEEASATSTDDGAVPPAAAACGVRPGSASPLTRRAMLAATGGLLLAACTQSTPRPSATASGPSPSPGGPVPTPSARPTPPSPSPSASPAPPVWPTREQLVQEFAGRKPKKFGIVVPGVVSEGRRDIGLTFDACGGGRLGNGFDAKLIKLLEGHDVPATLFLNGRWIEANPTIAADLAANPRFELANHGWEHRPLTVTGKSAYGIQGTAGPGEAYDEIVRGIDALGEVTGERSPYFRPGTAWSDDVAVELAARLGVSVIAFTINGDAGATAPKRAVAANFGKAKDGSIVLAHFNRPEHATAEGLAKALPRLLDAGSIFATLTAALS